MGRHLERELPAGRLAQHPGPGCRRREQLGVVTTVWFQFGSTAAPGGWTIVQSNDFNG